MSKFEDEKLERLAEIEGTTSEQMVAEATFDGFCYGICMNLFCDYTTSVEPDQDKGYCESCDTHTVKSCLMLAGVV